MNDGVPKKDFKFRIVNFFKTYGHNLDITLIMHVMIYVIVIVLFPTTSIFVSMLTIDSTIAALQFIKTINEGKDDIINRYKMNKMYETDLLIRKAQEYIEKKYTENISQFRFNNEGYINSIKKYFMYLIIQLLSYIFEIGSWGYGLRVFNMFLLLCSLPLFYIIITSSIYFLKIFKILTSAFKSISVFVLSKLTAKIINNLAETCTGSSPKIDYSEMIDFYENFDDSIGSTILFFKTVFVQTVIFYIKKTNNVFYYYLVDIFHKYQIETLLARDSGISIDAKSKLLYDIIKNRQWNKFLEPKSVNIIFELYENKNNDMYSRRIGVLFRNVQLNFIRFTTLWSIAILSPLTAICIDIYFTFIDNRFGISHNYISYLIGAVILYFNNCLLGASLVVLSEIITKPIIDYIDEKHLVSTFIIGSREQIKYLAVIPLVWKMSYYSCAIPLIMFYLNHLKFLNGMIFVSIILSLLSENNLLHITFLVIFSLLTNNILDYKNKVESNKADMHVTMIDDYLDSDKQLQKRQDIGALNMKNNKMIKVYESPDYADKKNVCKWISSWIY